ncbi:hypothetical protein [Streptomyces sp. NBC_00996]|uniref:hypothetical protein n=1 Tax=Streptomyces sp. NBC_00996 TaxID=2903710 RepID=UPI00386A1D42|nr:hypothetical protein OG390_35765 [Streptomyces sp. NBC_00996]
MGGTTRESKTPRPDAGEPDIRTDQDLADTRAGSKSADDTGPAQAPAAGRAADGQRQAEPGDATPATARPPSRGRADRAGLIAGGAMLAACAGLVLYGVLNTGPSGGKPEHRPPTAAVTYEITGTADISYQARSATGKATVVKAAALPWHKSVEVPLGRDPIVSITLGDNGGQARCTLTIRGHYIQSATATGHFGRATCTGSLPAPDEPAGQPDQ